MPTNVLDLCHMQDSRNNFDAMRPVPVCSDANQIVGQCHRKIHISNNCYYGYQLPHDQSKTKNETEDCEMTEVSPETGGVPSPYCNARKRVANLIDFTQTQPQNKRPREERVRNIEPETNEKLKKVKSPEELMEEMYWNTHGGHFFNVLQCST